MNTKLGNYTTNLTIETPLQSYTVKSREGLNHRLIALISYPDNFPMKVVGTIEDVAFYEVFTNAEDCKGLINVLYTQPPFIITP